MVSPTFSPASAAIRSAAARAASRRGERSRISPVHQGSPSRAGATPVVLPAPGGATRTALLPARRAASKSGRTSSIGSVLTRRSLAGCRSISSRDGEGDGLGQRRFGAAGREGAERVDRALAEQAGALDRVVERAAAAQQAGRLRELGVAG